MLLCNQLLSLKAGRLLATSERAVCPGCPGPTWACAQSVHQGSIFFLTELLSRRV